MSFGYNNFSAVIFEKSLSKSPLSRETSAFLFLYYNLNVID